MKQFRELIVLQCTLREMAIFMKCSNFNIRKLFYEILNRIFHSFALKVNENKFLCRVLQYREVNSSQNPSPIGFFVGK